MMNLKSLFAASALILTPTLLFGETPKEAAMSVAKAAGLEKFSSVTQIDFTFHVDLGEKKVVRQWSWQPQEGKISLLPSDPAGKAISYNKSAISSSADEELLKIDSQFVNDSYWLLFPLQVAWDSSLKLTEIPAAARIQAAKDTKGFRVIYPSEGGYTPGDVYDVYYDESHLITHWAFFPGGAEKPKIATLWTDYEKKGPLMISTNHPATEGAFRQWFTDITVK